MDVLKFSGVYPESWIFAITEYFSLLNTPADQWLKIVGFNLEGAAAEWFQRMKRNGLITTWGRFEESVRNCFGPSEYEDPNGALSKLLQLGTVKDYQREFEKLMNRAMDIPDSFLISYYIFGLKLHLQRELLVSKPTTLGDVFSLNNDAQDQVSELEMKVLVDGKQYDEAKVVKVVVVAVKQNIDEPDVEGNGVIGVGVNENKKGVQYSVSTLHVLILLLERLNDQYIKKKKMEATIQRRFFGIPGGIKIIFFRPKTLSTSEDDYDRGCRKPSDLEDGFYKDTIKLGPEYLTGMDDEGEVTLYLMRRSLEVLRKFHWMILGGRFNQLSHVSSPLLSKPGEY
ncbi:ty3-gypsy retrotransposon protein [Tanacetum coccineum]